MRKPVLRIVGWISYLTGIVQVLHVLQLILMVTVTGRADPAILLLNLITVLMGLLLMLTGYVFRKPLASQMLLAAGAAFGHWILTLCYMALYSSDFVPGSPFLYGYAYLDYVAFWSMLSGFSIWLGLTGLYQYLLPEEPDFVSGSGRFRWTGLLVVLGVLLSGMFLAGSPIAFVDPASFLLVVAPLPVLLWLSGLRAPGLIEFFAGVLSLSLVRKPHVGSFEDHARKAGRYALTLGVLVTLIGLVTLLGDLGDPSTLGPSAAVTLISLFYGLLLKTVVFDPYAGGLKRADETPGD